MQKLELQWREFNVDLEAVEAKMKTDYPESYKGNQSGLCLELWFDELPSQEDCEAIQAWWDALTAESDEAVSYRSQAQIQAAIAQIKEGIPEKTWNTMITIERRLQMGLPVSKNDLIAAELL